MSPVVHRYFRNSDGLNMNFTNALLLYFERYGCIISVVLFGILRFKRQQNVISNRLT